MNLLNNQIIQGDALMELRKIPDESVDCVITSPPYWGLRDYGVDSQLGLEKTPEEYITKMVEVFREVRRVLKKEGTCWLNLGDSYVSGKGRYSSVEQTIAGKPRGEPVNHNRPDLRHHGFLKDKDLAGIPWRVAFALQADGWYLRQDIIWAKPNPMPESVTDRCTKSHEYIFLLTKSPKYYFDGEAIKEKTLTQDNSNRNRDITKLNNTPGRSKMAGLKTNKYNLRNKRSVWTITTKPFKEAHFATFPEDLIAPMVKAGTSEKGVCPDCGKAWERVLKRKHYGDWEPDRSRRLEVGTSVVSPKELGERAGGYEPPQTLGWQPTCKCGKKPIPAVVLDPFIGSGTAGLVAKKLGRNWLGIELNPKYCEMAEKRIGKMPERLI